MLLLPGAIDNVEHLFARRETALASNRKRAARVWPHGVDAASVVAFQVLAALVGPEHEDKTAVLATSVRQARELTPAGALETLDVGVLELDVVVPAARGARQAVQIELARGPGVDRVAGHALADDEVAVVRHTHERHSLERPPPRHGVR